MRDKAAISKEELSRRRFDLKINQALVEEAKANLQDAQAHLSLHTVVSPIKGEILQVDIRQGEFAQAGQLNVDPLMRLGDTSYLHARIDVDEFDINKQRTKTQKRSYDLNVTRFKAGIAPEVDASQAQALLATTKAVLPSLEFQLAESAYRLAILTGQVPGTIEELFDVQDIPEVPEMPASGLPSDLLQNRPDIMAAEMALKSANTRVGIAEAEYFPKFSLIGTVGFETLKDNSLFNADARFLSLGPSFQWRVLEFWRIDDEISEAKGQRREALANYKKSVLNALGDVETSLVSIVMRDFIFSRCL